MADLESALNRNDTVQHGDASISQNLDYYHPLYLAAIKGNWEAAKKFLDSDPSAVTAKINRKEMTALHVAAGEGQSEFVEKIIDRMPMEALTMQDYRGRTALHYAAIAGSLKTAVALVEKNPALTNVLDQTGKTPLLVSSTFIYENYDVLWYLTLATKDEQTSAPFSGPLGMELVVLLVASGFLDIVLYLLQFYRGLATIDYGVNGDNSLLDVLADAPSNFFSGSRLGFWEGCIYSVIPIRKSYEPPQHVKSIIKDAHKEGSQHLSGVASTSKQNADHQGYKGLDRLQRLFFSIFRQITPSYIQRLGDAKYKHYCAVELFKKACTLISEEPGSPNVSFFSQGKLLHRAISHGTIEIVRIILQLCPDLQWLCINEKFPVHVAVKSRRENVFGLFCGKNARNTIQSYATENESTILHLAAKRPPLPQILSVSGAALQMQREMMWFKEVENLLHPLTRIWENAEGKTAGELFTVEHKELAESGEKWMKDTSNSCLIVATLIATVVFAAAFTVPGGNNGDSGVPIFLRTDAFLVFIVSDALALFSSLTSVLLFLSILTARYAEEDFVESLPKRLILGLASLLFAITAMMVAFGATLSIVLTERLRWIVVPTALLSSIPVAVFIGLQLPLFIEMVRTTFGFTFRPESPW